MHAGGRADRASPFSFPFVSRPLCLGCSPSPPQLTHHPLHAPTPTLCTNAGEGQEGQCTPPLPFIPRPRLCHPCPLGYDPPHPTLPRPPPSTWAVPLPPPPFMCPTTSAHPFVHILEAQEGLGCMQVEGHTEGAMHKGATHQGRLARKGTMHKGRGHGMMGGATWAAKGGDAKGV